MSVSDTESDDIDAVDEGEGTEASPSNRKHSRSPSMELNVAPVPKKLRSGTRTAARKISKSSALARDAEKESEGTRHPEPIAQGAGNPYFDYF